jgi:hypothetical protein
MQLIYKPAGLTINQFIKIIKEKYQNEKICYAGRLDPMARGLVPVLFNEECNNMENFTTMSKTYQVMIMIGIQTDTDDGLGLITNNLLEGINNNSADSDSENLKEFLADNGNLSNSADNTIKSSVKIPSNIEDLAIFMDAYKTDLQLKNKELYQKFHYYSSKAINKRTHNDFSESFHNVRINSSSIIDSGILPYSMFRENLIQTINKVDKLKNFRQNQIIEQWENLNINSISYIHIEINVSSGFFIRQFVRDLSTTIGIPLMAHDIHRTKLSIVN